MIVKKKANLEMLDWELLEDFQRKLAENLKPKDLGKKLSDLLKIMELKYKIKDESQKEKIFWELVEDLRKEVLGETESRRHEKEEALNHEGTKRTTSAKKGKGKKKNLTADKTDEADESHNENLGAKQAGSENV